MVVVINVVIVIYLIREVRRKQKQHGFLTRVFLVEKTRAENPCHYFFTTFLSCLGFLTSFLRTLFPLPMIGLLHAVSAVLPYSREYGRAANCETSYQVRPSRPVE